MYSAQLVRRAFFVTTMLLVSVALSTSAIAQEADPPTNIGLQLVADGFTSPVDLEQPDDGTGRLFIVDQIGVIYIVNEDGERLDAPFLDIRDQMVELREGFDERGLLGMALHPDFADNGRFFVYYSAPLQDGGPEEWDHTAHVSEFTVSADNADAADRDSERLVLAVDQPQFNHNAGVITFGPDGFLYVPLGDGGGADDTGTGHTDDIGNAQDTSNLLGSILRLDVDNGDPYGIPDDNPFVDDDAVLDEIWAYGFRNPWRMSYDEEYGWLVADVGQALWEEVNIVTAGGNFGWNIREGSHCFNPDFSTHSPLECPIEGMNGEPLQMPIIEYRQPYGIAIIGGFVYRGSELPDGFQGTYIFGDWSTSFGQPGGKVLVAIPPPADAPPSMWHFRELAIEGSDNQELNAFLLSLGQDANGELYALTTQMSGPTGDTGSVWRLVGAEG